MIFSLDYFYVTSKQLSYSEFLRESCVYVKEERKKHPIRITVHFDTVMPPLFLWLMLWSDIKYYVSFVERGKKRKNNESDSFHILK